MNSRKSFKWNDRKTQLLVKYHEQFRFSFKKIGETPPFVGLSRAALIGKYWRSRKQWGDPEFVETRGKRESKPSSPVYNKGMKVLVKLPVNYRNRVCPLDGCRLPRQPGFPFCATHNHEHARTNDHGRAK